MMKTDDDDSVKSVSIKKEVRSSVDHFKLDTTSDLIQFEKTLKNLTSRQRRNMRQTKKMLKYRKMLETLPLSPRQSESSKTLPFVPNWSYQNPRTAPPASPLVKSEPDWSYLNLRTAPPTEPLVKSEPDWSYLNPRTAPPTEPLVKSEPDWSNLNPRTAPPTEPLVKSEPEFSIAVPVVPNWGHQNRPTRIIQPTYPNILNDNAEDTLKTGLRPVIIDGLANSQKFEKTLKNLTSRQRRNMRHTKKTLKYRKMLETLPLSPRQSESSKTLPFVPNWSYQNPRTTPPTSPLVKSEPESSIAVSVVPNWGHQNSPTRIIQLSYPNILNDSAEDTQKTGLRPVIIDGRNVGFRYGKGNFDMRGPILVIQYFKNRGHDEIVCFLPQNYRNRVRSPSEDRTVSNLEKEDMFSFTPSRNLVNGKNYTPCDERFILQYAAERQGVIISNDGYRDLIEEEPSWKETIEKRIINYIFVRDIFMLSIDPLGPAGPKLDEILKFPSE